MVIPYSPAVGFSACFMLNAAIAYKYKCNRLLHRSHFHHRLIMPNHHSSDTTRRHDDVKQTNRKLLTRNKYIIACLHKCFTQSTVRLDNCCGRVNNECPYSETNA